MTHAPNRSRQAAAARIAPTRMAAEMRVKGYSDAWIGGLAIVLFSAALLIGTRPAGAQHVEVPPTWGGPLLERPRLTGDWGGVRDDLFMFCLVLVGVV